MEPISFPQANATFVMPGSTPEEPIGKLPVCRTVDTDGLPCLISCWKNGDSVVWLVVAGSSHPPVSLRTDSPFDLPIENYDPAQ